MIFQALQDPCTSLNSPIQALRMQTTKSLYTTSAYRLTGFTTLGRRKSRRSFLFRISVELPIMARIFGTTIRFLQCDGTSNTSGCLPYQGVAYQPIVVVSLLEQIPWKGTNTQQLKAGPNSRPCTVSLPDVNNKDWISSWSMDGTPCVYPLAVGHSPTGC